MRNQFKSMRIDAISVRNDAKSMRKRCEDNAISVRIRCEDMRTELMRTGVNRDESMHARNDMPSMKVEVNGCEKRDMCPNDDPNRCDADAIKLRYQCNISVTSGLYQWEVGTNRYGMGAKSLRIDAETTQVHAMSLTRRCESMSNDAISKGNRCESVRYRCEPDAN